MVSGSARPKTVAPMVTPMVCPICLVVSNIPEAKLRFSGKVFMTRALLAVLNRLEPMYAGSINSGNPHTGTLPAKNPTSKNPGVPDGMKVDVEGNVYCGGSGGLWILDSSGKPLGVVAHGATATTNLAMGGGDWKTLFFTTRNSLHSVPIKIAGIPVPGSG